MVDMSEDMNKLGSFSFWIPSDACRFSWCFISLYIADMSCNMIAYILGSLSIIWLLLNIDSFINPVHNFIV